MRKIKLFCILLCMLICFSGTVTAFASGEDSARLYHVTDDAGLLTAEEKAQLESRASEISQSMECAVYIVSVQDYTAFTSGSVRDCAERIYSEYELGWGDSKDGVMLLLSMRERDYSLIAYGTFGNAAFTDYGKDVLAEEFLDDFGNDDWFDGFYDYVEYSGKMMEMARQGTPLDVNVYSGTQESDASAKLLMIIFPPCVIALLVCLVFLAQMKTAKKKHSAGDYVVPGSANLYARHDIFIHRTETRQIIQQPKSGGTTINSRGFSGKSGKF